MSKTNAQLSAELKATQAELEEIRAEAEALRNRSPRERFTVVSFFNEDATLENKQPQLRSCFRFVVPDGYSAGDPIWLDLGQYYYDPETCPLKFDPKGKLPELTGSISVTNPSFAREQEAKREEALRRSGVRTRV